MKLDKFTVKAQEALQEAQAVARKRDHQEILPEHVLSALLGQQDRSEERRVGKEC